MTYCLIQTLWELSNEFKRLKRPKRGFFVNDVSFDFEELTGAVEEVQCKKESQMKQSLEQLEIPLVRGRSIAKALAVAYVFPASWNRSVY